MVERDPDAFLATLTDDFFNRRFLYEVRSQELSDYWSEDVDTREYLRRIEYYGDVGYEQLGVAFVTTATVRGSSPWASVGARIDLVWEESTASTDPINHSSIKPGSPVTL